jgi:uncharacterized protein (DUF2141 family)
LKTFGLLSVIPLLIISCATPSAPSGGEGDKEGPQLLLTIPETGTTNFKGRTVEFHFNEFIDRRNIRQSITVEPNVGIGYEINWKRKDLSISFDESLPDSTTILIKLGADISDTHNNKIGKPITLAVSTGDEIDKGKLTGRLLRAYDGTSAEEQDILLYRRPVDFSKRANYYAQTDTSGRFEFSYLSDGIYKVLVLNDRNRNKTWDRNNETAYPFNEEWIELQKEGSDTLDVLYISQVDSISPSLQGVGLYSQNRMRLRFSEGIQFSSEAVITISDSAGLAYTTAFPLYISPKEGFVAFANSVTPLLEGKEYKLNLQGFTDKAGNQPAGKDFIFTGSSQDDTTQQRIISAGGQQGLLQNESLKITYATPIQEDEIMDSTVVIEGTIDFENWPNLRTESNHLFIEPQGEWIEDVEYQFLVWNPKTQRRKLFDPEIWDSTEYGEIELTLENTDTTKAHLVQLLNSDGEQLRNETFYGSGMIENVPPLTYTLIIFRDENENSKWDKGTVIPYQKPEPYYVQRGLKVREGFTSGVRISFE